MPKHYYCVLSKTTPTNILLLLLLQFLINFDAVCGILFRNAASLNLSEHNFKLEIQKMPFFVILENITNPKISPLTLERR